MDEQVRAGLVRFLEDASKPMAPKRKRTVSEVSPNESENLPLQQPLVAIQAQPNVVAPCTIYLYYMLDGRAG